MHFYRFIGFVEKTSFKLFAVFTERSPKYCKIPGKLFPPKGADTVLAVF